MNSVKYQYTKLIFRNSLYFYTPITNVQKVKLRKKSHLQLHLKFHKKPRINLTKEVNPENYKILK